MTEFTSLPSIQMLSFTTNRRIRHNFSNLTDVFHHVMLTKMSLYIVHELSPSLHWQWMIDRGWETGTAIIQFKINVVWKAVTENSCRAFCSFWCIHRPLHRLTDEHKKLNKKYIERKRLHLEAWPYKKLYIKRVKSSTYTLTKHETLNQTRASIRFILVSAGPSSAENSKIRIGLA